MTNFRLFQTERVCRRQFQIWRNWKKVIQTGRKHCGKRRNCSLRAISPFPDSVLKRLVSLGCQKVSLCGNGLSQHFDNNVLVMSRTFSLVTTLPIPYQHQTSSVTRHNSADSVPTRGRQ